PADVDATCHFLGQMCRIDVARAATNDLRTLHDQIEKAFVRWVRAESAAAPLLIVFEDLHWADALSAALCERLLIEAREAPLLFVALARPEVEHLFPSFWSSQFLQELPLRALGPRACERLVTAVVGRPLGADVVARVVARSAGNPLHLEQLIEAAAAAEDDAVPEALMAMLQASFGQLDPLSRLLLRVASVFGEHFSLAGLHALAGDDLSESAIEHAVASLVRREILERGDAPGSFRFRNALV